MDAPRLLAMGLQYKPVTLAFGVEHSLLRVWRRARLAAPRVSTGLPIVDGELPSGFTQLARQRSAPPTIATAPVRCRGFGQQLYPHRAVKQLSGEQDPRPISAKPEAQAHCGG